MKKILKILFTFMGIGFFVSCICGEVDGVGRFGMIVMGTLFTCLGSFIR